MAIRRRRGWELPEAAATPEAVFHRRRELIKGLAAGPVLALGACRTPMRGERTLPMSSRPSWSGDCQMCV